MWKEARRRSRLEQTALTLLVMLFGGWITMPSARALPLEIPVSTDADDGEELDDSTWVASGTPIQLGRSSDGHVHDLALRFLVQDLTPGQPVLWARLRFSSAGGCVPDSLPVRISGAREIDSPALDQDRRPSRLPRTSAASTWLIQEPWPWLEGNIVFSYSPEITDIVNEIVTLPGWGIGSSALILCLDDARAAGAPTDYVAAEAYSPSRWAPTLQVARTIDEAFLCHESLARPTDRAATVHFIPLIDMEAMVRYGPTGGESSTTPRLAPAGASCRIVLDDLEADTGYTYQLLFRKAGTEDPYSAGPAHAFRTQRPRGASFTFTTEADSHLWDYWQLQPTAPEGIQLYQVTQQNIRADAPDLHLNLGDFSMTEYSVTREDTYDRYATQRRFLDPTTASTPFYLVLGNHEGELGWKYVKGDSLPVRAESARLLEIANPFPDGFYDGCVDSAVSRPQLRESYYSWEWGDALFVVLDPFWHTTRRPYHTHHPDPDNGWKWTLGYAQYEWLFQVLQRSTAHWKIVLLHHLTGGVAGETGFYGRGGIEAVKWQVAHRPTFEWGGENEFGQFVFPWRRYGWSHGPIHDLLKNAGVQLVIHGHDHFCALQQWDGITYMLCPQPADPSYGFGALSTGGYTNGILRANSGHLRFRVSPTDIIVQYVRAYLPGDGENGTIALNFSLTSGSLAVEPPGGTPAALRIQPNPAGVDQEVLFRLPAPAAGALEVQIFDVVGRLRGTTVSRPDGTARWLARCPNGERLPHGVYWCRVHADRGGDDLQGRLVLTE